MEPKTLSASALQAYETCPARFKASYIDRTPNFSGTAADLGTACHEAIEVYVANDGHLNPNLDLLLKCFDVAYWKLFSDNDRYDEGRDMLESWWNRTDLRDGRTILSTEVKETFDLKFTLSNGEKRVIPVTYIFDRCDELPDDKGIEVVDYKSTVIPIQPEDLRKKIQPRVYALAAAIKYPNRSTYWVTFDLLRYDMVGLKFTREDNIETYRYLQKAARRIFEDDGTTERLNPECRFCVRKPVCEALTAHTKGGGPLGIHETQAAIDRRAQLEYARAALDVQIKDLDQFIMAKAEEDGWLEKRTENTAIKISAKTMREIDAERAAKVIGAELVAKYGKLNISAVDEILKSGGLDNETKSALRGLIRRKLSRPSVKTSPLGVIGEDDAE